MQLHSTGFERCLLIDHNRQWLVVHIDDFERVVRNLTGFGNSQRERLTHIARAVGCEWRMWWHDGVADYPIWLDVSYFAGKVRTRKHADNASHGRCRRDIDRAN